VYHISFHLPESVTMLQKTSASVRVLLTALLISFSTPLLAQVSISDPGCVVAGKTYIYNFVGSYNASTTMTWCISSNGTIVQVFGSNVTGTGLCRSGNIGSIYVTWNTSGPGSVSLTSSNGNAPTKNFTVAAALAAGAISNTSQSIAYNTTPSTLNCSAATNGACSPVYAYQWQQSTDNVSFSDISGATSQNLTFTTPLTATRYYRRRVTETTQSTTLYSNVATVTVQAPFTGVTLSPSSQDIYTGSTPAAITGPAATGGSCGGNYLYQWEYSTNGGNSYSDVSGATGLNYSPGALTQTTMYRRKNTCGSEIAYSSVSVVNVYNYLTAGTISPSSYTVNFNSSPGFITISNASGDMCTTLDYTYQWQKSSDGINFTDISGATTSLNFNPGALITTTYFRRKVFCQQNVAYSNVATVTVHPQIFPGRIIPGALAIPANTSPGEFKVDAAKGGNCNNTFSYQWQKSTVSDPYVWTDISGATGLNYSPGSVPVTTYYVRKVTCGSQIVYSNVCKVEIAAPKYNVVRNRTIAKPGVSTLADANLLTSPFDVIETSAYFDGLGRPSQTIIKQNSPLQKDIVTANIYDEFGRETMKFLPYVSSQMDGRYRAIPTSETFSFYVNGTADKVADDTKPYNETIFERSPLQKVIKQGAPGLAWQPDEVNSFGSTDYTVKKNYESNGANEVLRWSYVAPSVNAVELLGQVNAGTALSPVYYEPNKLTKNISRDEHGNDVIEYSDKSGNVVLKRVKAVGGSVAINDTKYASTYYIYDDYNNLVCVLPPEATARVGAEYHHATATHASKESFLRRWSFRYRYDARKRLIQKHVPGAGQVRMVYDQRDRLVMTQDSVQRSGATKYWTFTKYDLLNRPVATGIMESSNTHVQAQAAVMSHYNAMGSNKVWGESYVGAGASGNLHGYTNVTYPTTITAAPGANAAANNYLTVTYYDNYDFRSMWGGRKYINDTLTHKLNGVVQYTQQTIENKNVIGQATGMKVKVLDNSVAGGYIWLRSVNYYDDRYRIIQTHADNLNGGVDRTSTLYDFTGKVLVTKQFHNVINWTSLQNATGSFSTLTRNGGGSGWNTSGGASQSYLAAGEDGAFEFVTTDENVAKKAIGLSGANPDTNYTTCQFCFFLDNGNSTLRIYESSVEKYVGTYAANDVFRIERVNGVIKYYRNGNLIPITHTASTGQLMVDAAFGTTTGVIPYGTFTASSHPTVVTRRFKYDHAGRLTKTYHRLGQGELVNWTGISSNISATDGVIGRTSGSAGWTAGASSSQTIPASTDGWLEARSPQTNSPVMIGLSDQDVNVNYTSIDYALYFYSNGAIYVYESGSNRGIVGTYTAKDVFRIERIGQTIVYKKNQRVIYTSGVPSTSSLLADCSIYQIGGALDQVHIGKGLGASYVLLGENQYNELGQLIDKKLHSANGAAAKQSVDHRYNIRGWLTSINDAALTIDGTDPKDHFGMELGYNEEIGSGNTEHDPNLDGSLVAQYHLNGNATDDAPNGINGTLQGSPQPTADAQGNAGQAYSFATNDYISIPGSQSKYAFVHNTGKFTISVFVKLSNIDARSMIIGNTTTSVDKGFFLMYENYAGLADHQLRFTFVKAVSGQAFNVVGAVRTINDTNWHHVSVVGDGEVIRFYVDGRPDGAPQPITATYLTTGNATNNLSLAKVATLPFVGSLDEVTILNRALTPDELQLLVKREPITAKINLRQYNGNISGVKWSKDLGLSDKKMQAYSYSYDAMNRLSTSNHKLLTAPSIWTTGLFDENILAYDLNGNILDLQRTGQSINVGARIDNMTYNYGSGTTASNKLIFIRDNIANTTDRSKGFNDGYTGAIDYAYDANGNMRTDQNKNITAITYNYLNLPLSVVRGANAVGYTYDATGRKLMQTMTGGKKTYYSGEFVYENDVLQYVSHDEGRIVVTDETKIFQYGFDEVNPSLWTVTAASQTAVTINDQKYVQFTHTDTNSMQGPDNIGGAFTVVPGERYKVRMRGYRLQSDTWLGVTFTGSTSAYTQGPSLPSQAAGESWAEMTVTVPSWATSLSLRVSWPAASNGHIFLLNDVELIKLESTAPEYQYSLKDHLGNVRLSFTTKDEEDKYTATFEDNTEAIESKQFQNYSRVTNDLFDHTDAGTTYNKAQLLNGGNNSQVGAAKTFAVMPGDVVNAQAYARYFDATSSGGQVSNFGAALLGAFGVAAPGVGEVGTAAAGLDSYGAVIEGLNGTHGTETVQGWLTILVFDKDFNLLVNDSDFDQLDDAYGHAPGDPNKGPHDLLTANVNIKEPGYVFIYVSNEGAVQQDIYFDDITISHTKSPVIQIDDYYPFGATFNSSRRENTIDQSFLYQEKEWQQDLDLNLYDFEWRQYDPFTARTTTLDPHGDSYFRFSPYSWTANNPINTIDPDGRDYHRTVLGITATGADAQALVSQLQAQLLSGEVGGGNNGPGPKSDPQPKKPSTAEVIFGRIWAAFGDMRKTWNVNIPQAPKLPKFQTITTGDGKSDYSGNLAKPDPDALTITLHTDILALLEYFFPSKRPDAKDKTKDSDKAALEQFKPEAPKSDPVVFQCEGGCGGDFLDSAGVHWPINLNPGGVRRMPTEKRKGHNAMPKELAEIFLKN
jgi:RHS repeat-associated protein